MGLRYLYDMDHRKCPQIVGGEMGSYGAMDDINDLPFGVDDYPFPGDDADCGGNMDPGLYCSMPTDMPSGQSSGYDIAQNWCLHMHDVPPSLDILNPISPKEYWHNSTCGDPDACDSFSVPELIEPAPGIIDQDQFDPLILDFNGHGSGAQQHHENFRWDDTVVYMPDLELETISHDATQVGSVERANNCGPVFRDEDWPTELAFLGPTTQDTSMDEFVNSDAWEVEPFQNNPLPPVDPSPAAAPNETPTVSPPRRALARSARRSDAGASLPGPRSGKRPYKRNRQRVELGGVRQRIRCGLDGCTFEYASPGTVYRHRQNTHWSKGRFGAKCLFPGCTTELWAGMEPKAWDNLKTHQSQKHRSWILGKTKDERCRMTKDPEPSSA
ncbi:hypothetical protein TWF730_007039 [Orbilia blumenaviensis]|uniref:C2H2-type domain-containing protein n=1 Tax=Orbilia blumenaviensis TaxID=1796055 RepID=A0AAV9VGE7_9PEZI